MAENFYKILGIDETASESEIKIQTKIMEIQKQ